MQTWTLSLFPLHCLALCVYKYLSAKREIMFVIFNILLILWCFHFVQTNRDVTQFVDSSLTQTCFVLTFVIQFKNVC